MDNIKMSHLFKYSLSSMERKNQQTERVLEFQAKDPVARQTDWAPCRSWGVRFKTHTLTQTQQHRFEFKLSMMAKIFPIIFFFLSFLFVNVQLLTPQHAPSLILPFVFSLPFAGFGVYVWIKLTRPIIFDGVIRCYWKGHKNPMRCLERARFGEVHAVQLISSGRNSRFRSYELNLVLRDGQRMNVIHHGSLKVIREDAERVAALLDKHLWDIV
jgi:hypothetical protein